MTHRTTDFVLSLLIGLGVLAGIICVLVVCSGCRMDVHLFGKYYRDDPRELAEPALIVEDSDAHD